MSIDHLYYNGRKGPVEPLSLPPGARMLARPVQLDTGGWVPQTVDAVLEFEGVTWARVQGGFGDGQRTGWHPREDWVAVVPAVAISVSRYFDKPDVWDRKSQTMQEAMRAEVQTKLGHARYTLREAQERVRRLERAIALLES